MTSPLHDADITALILRDHNWFREQFAELDYLRADHAGQQALTRIWKPLADRLDVHAAAEEEIFYPALLKKGDDEAEDETLDAIGDHNDIRDGVRDANDADTGSDAWWTAVGKAREANDEHMGEEEHEGLAEFRLHADDELRQSLGRKFLDFLSEHPTAADVDTEDKDPKAYVAENS